jgi:hypothetical protein
MNTVFPVFYPNTLPPAAISRRGGKHFYSLRIARVRNSAILSLRISLVFALLSPFIVLLVVAISLVSITVLIPLVPFLLVAFVSIRSGGANALLLSTLFGLSVGIVAVHIGIIVLLILVGTLVGLSVFSRILCLLFLRRFSAHHFLLWPCWAFLLFQENISP